MVLKKAPDKHGSRAEPKGGHARTENRLYSYRNLDGMGGGSGGGGLKKMLSRSRSIKVLEESLDSPLACQLVRLGVPPASKNKKRLPPVGLPNYMKSTSSSIAKEQTRVSASTTGSSRLVATTNRVGTPGSSKPTCHSPKKKPISAAGFSGLKPAKFMARRPSLRVVRPLPTKKVVGVPRYPQPNAGWATCSSTMKEASFPNYLDLNPGATEAEGTSIYKVCPYTYCSLNGHRHAPLPPLKCFLTARRCQLKTQKSMMLRGLSSFKKTESKNEEAGIGVEQGTSPLIEDLGDDIFLEIYANGPTDALAPEGGSDVGVPPAAICGVPSAGEGAQGGEGWSEQMEDGSESLSDGSTSQTFFEDMFDRNSQFSPSEMDVLINFLEYVEECDSEDAPHPMREQGDRGRCDDGVALRNTNEFSNALAKREGVCEPEEGDDDGSDVDIDEYAYFDLSEDESRGEVCDAEADKCEADVDGITGPEETVEADASTLEGIFGRKNEAERGDQFEGMVTEECDQEFKGCVIASNEPVEGGDPCEVIEPDDEVGDTFGFDLLFSGADADAVVDTDDEKEKEQGDDNGHASAIEREIWESEEVIQECLYLDEVSEESEDRLDAPSLPELPADASNITACPQTAAPAATTAGTGLVEDLIKRRGIIIGRANAGDAKEEDTRGFNPREPNFLPVEPDSETEKVDLRHQTIDDRKNSEEWMIDYALRRAVDKLAPGRKTKVALLVEAFETVAPVPAYGSSLGHSTMGLTPIQACS